MLIGLLAVAPVVAQPVPVSITNSGFESPDVPNGTFQANTSIPGWTFTAVGGFQDDGIVDPSSSFRSYIKPLPEGHQALCIQEATLHQDLGVNAAEGTCTLSFFAYVEDLAASTNAVRLYAGGVLLTEVNANTEDVWTQYVQGVTIGAGSPAIGQELRIEIDQWANPNLPTYYDKLELTCTPGTPTTPGVCAPSYATAVQSFHQGPYALANSGPNGALGNDTTTKFSSGNGGFITLCFPDKFTTGGDSLPDLCIDEFDYVDCYYLCFFITDPATIAAALAAGWHDNGNGSYEPNVLYCGDEDVDIDALLPGFQLGDLLFDKIMILDDGNGGGGGGGGDDDGSASATDNGFEIIRVEAKNVCPPPPPGPCYPSFALAVDSSHQGPGADPAKVASNALGDDINTFFQAGAGGSIKLNFGPAFSNSGDSSADICIDEPGDQDCYYVCLEITDPATIAAFTAAGFVLQNGYWEIGTFCGNENIDLDALVPGFALGDLRIDKIMLVDDNATHPSGNSNGFELSRIEAKYICPPGDPQTPDCVARFAVQVEGFMQGTNANANQGPSGALGNDTTTRFSAGGGGRIRLSFGGEVSTSGDNQADLCIDEYNVVDCYTVALLPVNIETENALINAGFTAMGALYTDNTLYCGDVNIDLDALIPGFSEGDLRFSQIMVVDDDSSSPSGDNNGYELVRFEAKFVCPPAPACLPEFASSVVDFIPGVGANGDPMNALGDTPGFVTLGDGGGLSVRFPGIYSSSGDTRPDICVAEDGFADSYDLLLDPANGATADALANAGLVQIGNFFMWPTTLVGTQAIDLDSVLPGFFEGELAFDRLLLLDVASTNNSAEIVSIEAKFVCGPAAKIGDRVYTDLNCDGIQDAIEGNVPGVVVTIADANTGTVVDMHVTDGSGSYCFFVAAGTYVVTFGPDQTMFTFAPQNQGGDPAVDSDPDPTTGTTGPVTVAGGDINLTVDAGLCLICVGPLAFKNENLPSCGPGVDPVLTATPPLIGSFWTLSLDSALPNANYFITVSPGAPQPQNILSSPCIFYVDPFTVFLLSQGLTDANGDWQMTIELPPMVALAGAEFTIQARVCDPPNPGPIPGTPDFFSNAIHIIIGCP